MKLKARLDPFPIPPSVRAQMDRHNEYIRRIVEEEMQRRDAILTILWAQMHADDLEYRGIKIECPRHDLNHWHAYLSDEVPWGEIHEYQD